MGAVLVAVAVATSQDVATILRAPYVRTLWTFYHVQQRERFDELRIRGRALNAASLGALAFHEPKRLGDEQRRLLEESGQLPTPAQAIESAGDIIAAVQHIDRVEGRIT